MHAAARVAEVPVQVAAPALERQRSPQGSSLDRTALSQDIMERLVMPLGSFTEKMARFQVIRALLDMRPVANSNTGETSASTTGYL